MSERASGVVAYRSSDVRGAIDVLAERYGAGEHKGEIEAAREQFDSRRGRAFDDDPVYADHMALFLEWYLLERPMDQSGVAPVVVALRCAELARIRALLVSLANSHRSVFEVTRWTDTTAFLQDLVGGGRWRARCERSWAALDPREIFEGRLIPWEGEVVLGPTVLFHPRQAREAVHRLIEVRRNRGQLDREVVFDLAEMRLRFSRLRHIAVEHVYRERSLAAPRPTPWRRS